MFRLAAILLATTEFVHGTKNLINGDNVEANQPKSVKDGSIKFLRRQLEDGLPRDQIKDAPIFIGPPEVEEVLCDKSGTDCTSPTCSARQNEQQCDSFSDSIIVPQGKSSSNKPISEDGFCIKFDEDGDQEGFAPCPGHYDNVLVRSSPDTSITNIDPDLNSEDTSVYLHVQDRSGASLACGTGSDYTGDWSPVVDKRCYELCYDANLLHDGTYLMTLIGR